MKVLLLRALFLLSGLSCLAIAEVPVEVTYQGKLAEYGQPVTGKRTMCFKIYDAATAGNQSWSSGNAQVSVSNGVFSYVLAPLNVDWRNKNYWIETIISDKILSPREKLTAQIFALHSRTAEDVEKSAGTIRFAIGNSTHVVITADGNVGIGTDNPTEKLHVATGGVKFPDGTVQISASGSGLWAPSGSNVYRDSGNVGIGTTNPTAKLHVVGGNTLLGGNVGIGTTNADIALNVAGEVKSLVSGTTFYMVPRGAIIMWAGTIGSIPSGWALCDGTNGTPNLSDKFILSINGTLENPGATGGAHSITLSVNQLPVHSHSASSGNQSADHTHSGTSSDAGSHSHSGTTSTDGSHAHDIARDDPSHYGVSIPLATARGIERESGYNCLTDAAGSHLHTLSMSTVANHNHSFSSGGVSANHNHSVSVNNTGSGESIDKRPAYFKLAFIMKL